MHDFRDIHELNVLYIGTQITSNCSPTIQLLKVLIDRQVSILPLGLRSQHDAVDMTNNRTGKAETTVLNKSFACPNIHQNCQYPARHAFTLDIVK